MKSQLETRSAALHSPRANNSAKTITRGAIARRLVARLAAFAAAAAILVGLAPSARASLITFAQFQEAANAPANPFSYIDNGVGHDAQLVGPAIPVSFQYLSLTGLPADLVGNQLATLNLTSSTTKTVTAVPLGGGTVAQQLIDGSGTLTDVLSFTRNTPAAEGLGSRTNLLTVTFTADVLGMIGGDPALSGDTALGSTISYSSDFLDFSATTQRDFSLVFSSWINNGGGNGLSINDVDNYFNSASAAATGTFDADSMPGPFIPEPATLSLAAVGLAGLLVGYRRTRRR